MLKQLQKISLLLIISFVNLTAQADKEILSAVNDFKTSRLLNATYLITEGDKIILEGASGYYDMDKHIMLQPDQVMPIASITKQFIAAAILKLYDQGKLTVNDNLVTALAGSKYIENIQLPDWAEKVTIHHLLTHTHGVAEYIPAYGSTFMVDGKKSLAENISGVFAYAFAKPLAFEPGSQYHYNNTGYTLLGAIIEAKSGMSLSEFLDTHFFKPLNLTNTKLADYKSAIDTQLGLTEGAYPKLYFAVITPNEMKFAPANLGFLLMPYAAGGIVSTTKDLETWTKALHNGKVISSEALNLMRGKHVKLDPAKHQYDGYYGYGLFVKELDNGEYMYYHGGRAVGIRSELNYLPATDTTIAIISNVMPFVPKEAEKYVDFKKEKHQLDIRYFLHKLLEKLHLRRVNSTAVGATAN